MKNRNNLTLLLILISISTLLYSCNKTNYVENRYSINGIKVTRIDSLNLFLKFETVFYSDSTQINLFPSGIEKGLDGSNDKILFIGFKDEKHNNSNDLIELTHNINLNKRGYRGEKLNNGYFIKNKEKNDLKNLILIIQRTNKIDTLKNIKSN